MTNTTGTNAVIQADTNKNVDISAGTTTNGGFINFFHDTIKTGGPNNANGYIRLDNTNATASQTASLSFVNPAGTTTYGTITSAYILNTFLGGPVNSVFIYGGTASYTSVVNFTSPANLTTINAGNTGIGYISICHGTNTFPGFITFNGPALAQGDNTGRLGWITCQDTANLSISAKTISINPAYGNAVATFSSSGLTVNAGSTNVATFSSTGLTVGSAIYTPTIVNTSSGNLTLFNTAPGSSSVVLNAGYAVIINCGVVGGPSTGVPVTSAPTIATFSSAGLTLTGGSTIGGLSLDGTNYPGFVLKSGGNNRGVFNCDTSTNNSGTVYITANSTNYGNNKVVISTLEGVSFQPDIATFSSNGYGSGHLTIHAGPTLNSDNNPVSGLTIIGGTSPAKLTIVPANGVGGSPMLRFYSSDGGVSEFGHRNSTTLVPSTFYLYSTAQRFDISVNGQVTPMFTIGTNNSATSYINNTGQYFPYNASIYKQIFYTNDGINPFYITVNGSNQYIIQVHGGAGLYLAYGGSSWTPNSSDERTKSNIKPYTTPTLDSINKLVPSYFQLKNDTTNKRRLGFIAQNMQTALPDLVVQSGADPTKYGLTEEDVKDDPLLTIETSDAMIPYLVKAVQELSAQVTSQESTINALQSQVNTLMEQMATLLAKN